MVLLVLTMTILLALALLFNYSFPILLILISPTVLLILASVQFVLTFNNSIVTFSKDFYRSYSVLSIHSPLWKKKLFIFPVKIKFNLFDARSGGRFGFVYSCSTTAEASNAAPAIKTGAESGCSGVDRCAYPVCLLTLSLSAYSFFSLTHTDWSKGGVTDNIKSTSLSSLGNRGIEDRQEHRL